MHYHPWFITVLKAATRRTPAGLGSATTMRHWVRSGALVVGTALGLSLAGAPVARSAQTDNQLSIETGNQLSVASGEVISVITVGAITQKTCAGASCACDAGQIATGGGAECNFRDTLISSVPSGTPANAWAATCVKLTEFRRPALLNNGGITLEPVVVDIVRQVGVAPPNFTHVICATP